VHGVTARPNESRWWFTGPDVGWAAFVMNLAHWSVGCPKMWCVSSLRTPLEGILFAQRINVLTVDLWCCTGWCGSNAKYFLIWVTFRQTCTSISPLGRVNTYKKVSIQKRDGWSTVHGCDALYCKLDVRVEHFNQTKSFAISATLKPFSRNSTC